jgi:MOSC domain-containing protein YiiM
MNEIKIVSLNIGLPEKVTFKNGGEIISGIRKKPSDKKIKLSKTGLKGDDSFEDCHGGPSRALHVFCFENYAFYNAKAGFEIPLPTFGENLTLQGYTEDKARVGDVLSIAESRVQVSQPTERCKNVGLAIGQPQMLRWIHESMKTGFYFRVLEEGFISSDSEITLLERGEESASIAHLNHIFYREIKDKDQVLKTSQNKDLSEEWKERLLKLHQRALND